ncbi:sensor histidine kinase [Brucellaceae bacterium C25G]
MRNAHVCILYQCSELKYIWSENLPPMWADKWFSGCTDTQLMSETEAEKLKAARQEAVISGTAKMVELNILTDASTRWYEFYIDCDYNQDGSLAGILTTMVDISELKRREQILKALLREVSHRSKNLLAIIQSVAAQTARFTDTIDGFLGKFRGRIHSLSQSQDLVTDSNWHGALFRDLVRSQLEKYTDINDSRIHLIGENPYLFPGAALHLGLALHELIVNATSYGGLNPQSKNYVVINMETATNAEGEQHLLFDWHETDFYNIPIDHSAPPRFGSAVLERIVPAVVDGKAEYSKDEQGVSYRLTIGKNHFDL